VQLQEFLEFQAQEPEEQLKVLSVTCADQEECLPQPRSGEDGIVRLTSSRNVTQSQLQLPLQQFQHWLWPEVTKSIQFQKSHWSWTALKKLKGQKTY
jgi:hypothetical protein